MKPKPRKRISAISQRQKQRNQEYAKAKRQWHRELKVICEYPTCLRPSEPSPHHTRGRIGKLLCDTRFWIAVCQKHHDWIHAHPQQARSLGLLCAKGDWGRQPKD
jgi:hypothetical protein